MKEKKIPGPLSSSLHGWLELREWQWWREERRWWRHGSHCKYICISQRIKKKQEQKNLPGARDAVVSQAPVVAIIRNPNLFISLV